MNGLGIDGGPAKVAIVSRHSIVARLCGQMKAADRNQVALDRNGISEARAAGAELGVVLRRFDDTRPPPLALILLEHMDPAGSGFADHEDIRVRRDGGAERRAGIGRQLADVLTLHGCRRSAEMKKKRCKQCACRGSPGQQTPYTNPNHGSHVPRNTTPNKK
ncbi:MAG: hypothetical protein ABJN75_03615 [Hoeflea sp.]|uniref:hypothetical protein n=1 Tax=Hoeflea sp. TaxID=1940281 RepID=UPI0032999694